MREEKKSSKLQTLSMYLIVNFCKILWDLYITNSSILEKFLLQEGLLAIKKQSQQISLKKLLKARTL